MDKDLLYRFFKGDVSIEEGQQVKAWVEASPENEQSFYKERKLFDALILHGLQYKPTRRTSTFFRMKTGWMKIAASIVLMLAFGYLYQEYRLSKDNIAMNTISVPEGQRTNLVLPDGTDVWLNSCTTIQYPLSFGKKNREVILKGEAYFDVKKNERKPFVVKTDGFDIEVLGTSFNVNARPDENRFETTLIRGSVKVASQKNPLQAVTLKPDQKVSLEKGKLKVAKIKNYDPYRWQEGIIGFYDEAFATIMSDLEKYYGVKVVINNKEAIKHYCTGKFRHSDGIDYALQILQKNIAFDYKKDDENRIIYIN